MGSAIGGSLVMAVGISITPLAMAAVVVLLSTARAHTNGIAYLIGWILGLVIVGVLAMAVISSEDPGSTSAPATWSSWMRIVLGALLMVLGVYEFRGSAASRPRRVVPQWVEKADNITPPVALSMGTVLAALRPKNVLLIVAGVAAIASAGLSGQQETIAYLVFAAIATIGVAIPVFLYLALGQRGPEATRALGEWLTANTGTILAVVCFLLAIDLIGRGLVGLTS